MNNVITHPRFDRPKVHQPHPRLKRGTISFRAALAERLMAKRLDGRKPAQVRADSDRALQAQETVSKVMRRMVHEDARDAEVLPLYIPNTGWRGHALLRLLLQLGIKFDYNFKHQAIVLHADGDDPDPRTAS